MKIIQAPRIETLVRGEIMAVKIPHGLMEVAHAPRDLYFFVDLEECKKLGVTQMSLGSLLRGPQRRYYYSNEHEKIQALTDTSESITTVDDIWETILSQNSMELLERADFDPDNLFYYWHGDNLIYKFRGDFPLTKKYHCDYIGGITNKHFCLDYAEILLRNNEWVSNINRVRIPYYNAEEGRNMAIEFDVMLPQNEFDEIVRKFRDIDAEKYWSVRLKESFHSPYAIKTYDPLGLRSALKEDVDD